MKSHDRESFCKVNTTIKGVKEPEPLGLSRQAGRFSDKAPFKYKA